MTAMDPDPIAATRCPRCLEPARHSTPYEIARTGRPWTCDPCNLHLSGTASEAARYAARRIADAAQRGNR